MAIRLRTCLLAFFLLAGGIGQACAHIGVGSVQGFAAGFLHPWHGADHLLAAFAVGWWAANLGGRALWLVPAAFVSVMAVGAGLDWAGFFLPDAEWPVSASVAVLGLALWRNWRAAAGRAAVLVGAFALFHGYVHAAELAAKAEAAGYVGGVLLATASLHALGILVGRRVRNVQPLGHTFGLFCTGFGVYLLAGF
jgi:urease accessory protein